MTIYDLKPAFQNFLRPAVNSLARGGVTPNQITTFTCILSVGLGIYLYSAPGEYFFMLPIFFFFRMALNAIDGMLAKEHNMKTKLGAILNEVTDVLSDGFLYFSFVRFSFISINLLFFIIFFSALTEVTGLSALLIGRDRQYAGPMGKSDRAFVFSVIALIITFYESASQVINGILWVTAVLLVLTIINRARHSLR